MLTRAAVGNYARFFAANRYNSVELRICTTMLAATTCAQCASSSQHFSERILAGKSGSHQRQFIVILESTRLVKMHRLST